MEFPLDVGNLDASSRGCLEIDVCFAWNPDVEIIVDLVSGIAPVFSALVLMSERPVHVYVDDIPFLCDVQSYFFFRFLDPALGPCLYGLIGEKLDLFSVIPGHDDRSENVVHLEVFKCGWILEMQCSVDFSFFLHTITIAMNKKCSDQNGDK